MRKILLVLIGMVLLAGCAPSQTAIKTAVAQTMAVIPTPTSTPIPFSALQLDSQLIQPGDLPAGCVGGQITNTRNPDHFYDKYSVPTPDYYIGEQIACGNFTGGLVQVFVYTNKANTSTAYQSIYVFLGSLFQGGTGNAVSLGDEGFGVESTLGETDLVVRHCNAVLTVDQAGDLAGMTAYAQRLDKRLNPTICR